MLSDVSNKVLEVASLVMRSQLASKDMTLSIVLDFLVASKFLVLNFKGVVEVRDGSIQEQKVIDFHVASSQMIIQIASN